jgi:hypothetical protein
MTTEEMELYQKTMARLHRAGCRTRAEQIVYLADEIERYRARIVGMERAQAAEITGPVMRFCANAYTSPFTDLPEEEKTRQTQDEMVKHLLYTLHACGCISYEMRPANAGHLRYTEHKATICVVMPKKEGQA